MNSRIQNYIAKIATIPEGQRNGELYNTGLLLRKNFGLTGNELFTALQIVNETKCTPPVNDSELRTIADSVDKSNAPLELMKARNGAQRNDRINPAGRSRHCDSLRSGISLTVGDILKNEVSIYNSAIETVSIKKATIGQVLERFTTGGKSKERILAIRNETDKNRRSELKKQLPGIVFASEPQTQRNVKSCKSNGVLCLDFDNIPLDELEWAKDKIAEVPYVFAVGMSVSGLGLFALVAYEGTPDLKILLSAMQADFPYPIDTSCSDLCRLRFETYDTNINVKDEVFPARLTEQSDHSVRPVLASKIIGGCFADVKDEPIDWLWEGRFARGHLQMIHGNPDSGKGYFTFWLASVVSRGGTFPDSTLCQQGNVLIVGTEEHAGYAKRKLAAQDTDMRNVHYITGYVDDDSEFPILLSDINIIQDKCDELKNNGMPVSLVIVDPLLQMLGVKSNDNSETQAALAPVKEFAERNDICFLCVNHDGKGQQDTAANRSLGAQSIMGKMRIGYTAKKELTTQDDEYPLHTLAVSKFNIGRRPKAITFRIVESPDDPEIGKVEILDIDGDFTADDKHGTSEGKFTLCCQWLQKIIPDDGIQKEDIFAEGKAEGFGQKLIFSAFKSLGGVSEKPFSGRAKWTLPNRGTATALVGENSNHSTSSAMIEELLQNKDSTVFFEGDASNHGSTACPLPRLDKNADSPHGCPNCKHYRPATYPTQGLCGKGRSQQDSRCHCFESD